MIETIKADKRHFNDFGWLTLIDHSPFRSITLEGTVLIDMPIKTDKNIIKSQIVTQTFIKSVNQGFTIAMVIGKA